MSTDNLFSVWASYLAQRLAWVVAAGFGLRRPGWHLGLEHQQAHGAILALFGWLVWGHRRALLSLVGLAPNPTRAAAATSPWLVAGAGFGFAAAVLWANAAGVPWWMAAFLFGMVYASGLVYARIRAETGLPSYWALPFTFEERDLLLDLVGTRTVLRGGGLQALAILSHFGWMTTGQYTQLAAYHLENQRLARVAELSPARMFALGLAAVATGLGVAYWTHLRTFYTMGALSAVGAGGDGYYEVRWAAGSYQQLLSVASRSVGSGPNGLRLLGAGLALALAALRGRFTWFPITPWGYLIASTYGGTYWASFFLTWVAQKIILRYGGMSLHTRAVPGFLGLSFGYMTATVAAVALGSATGRAFSFAAGRRLYFDI
jgi:hypothetical protein